MWMARAYGLFAFASTQLLLNCIVNCCTCRTLVYVSMNGVDGTYYHWYNGDQSQAIPFDHSCTKHSRVSDRFPQFSVGIGF